jgi:hypothetical protein
MEKNEIAAHISKWRDEEKLCAGCMGLICVVVEDEGGSLSL